MSILVPTFDDIMKLSRDSFEELIAFLAEAEIRVNGGDTEWVQRSGKLNSSDRGVDVTVKIPEEGFKLNYIPSNNTIFQVKKREVEKRDIKAIMCKGRGKKRELYDSIKDLSQNFGAYVIATIDNLGPDSIKNRTNEMKLIVDEYVPDNNLELKFFDLNAIGKWLRLHSDVVFWLKNEISKNFSGWRGFEPWSRPDPKCDDSLIESNGVYVELPRIDASLSILDGINSVRNLVRESKNAIRIIGHSGVGKTRFTQALFEKSVGIKPLENNNLYYADVGSYPPDPAPYIFVQQLLESKTENENASTFMVLDNCPIETHTTVNRVIRENGSKIRLITIEYDIKEDFSLETDRVSIKTCRPSSLSAKSNTAVELLLRRYPTLGKNNATRIARFSEGNLRLSILLAEQFQCGATSLAKLSNQELFERLFHQRNPSETNLFKLAQVLALVYTYSTKDGDTELEVLGKLVSSTADELFETSKILEKRQIVQSREHMSAILPEALANKLAKEILEQKLKSRILDVFEKSKSPRLLTSFSHRIGFLHDEKIVIEIAKNWLRPDGLLHNFANIAENQLKVVENLLPVEPVSIYSVIEKAVESQNFKNEIPNYSEHLETLLNSLVYLSKDPKFFSKCLNLMLKVVHVHTPFEDLDIIYEEMHQWSFVDFDFSFELNELDPGIRSILKVILPSYYCTKEFVEQRKSAIFDMMNDDDLKIQKLGFLLLYKALGELNLEYTRLENLDARPQSIEFDITNEVYTYWYKEFLGVAIKGAICNNANYRMSIRQILVKNIEWLWKFEPIRVDLVKGIRTIHSNREWFECWIVLKKMVKLAKGVKQADKNKDQTKKMLNELVSFLKPDSLTSRISVYVLGYSPDVYFLDDNFEESNANSFKRSTEHFNQVALKLGEEFSSEGRRISEMGFEIFESGPKYFLASFGKGIASGRLDSLKICWDEFIEFFHSYIRSKPGVDFNSLIGQPNISLFAGFMEQVGQVNVELARNLLDELVDCEILSNFLVDLQPSGSFEKQDFARCMSVLDRPNIRLDMYLPLLIDKRYTYMTDELKILLLKRLLNKKDGALVVVNAFWENLQSHTCDNNWLSGEFLKLGIQALTKNTENNPRSLDRYNDGIVELVKIFLQSNSSEELKYDWMRSFLSAINRCFNPKSFARDEVFKVVTTLIPRYFLDLLFDDEVVAKSIRESLLIEVDNGLLLSELDIDTLIQWCNSQDSIEIWELIAFGLNCFEQDEVSTNYKFSTRAKKFLFESPCPERILGCFESRIYPSTWTGKKSEEMKRRLEAFEVLQSHSNKEISSTVATIFKRLNLSIVNQQKEEEKNVNSDDLFI